MQDDQDETQVPSSEFYFLRLAYILKVREITCTVRVLHFICLRVQNTGLTYKLFLGSPPQRTKLQLWEHWQLLPRETVKWDAREAYRPEKERLSFLSQRFIKCWPSEYHRNSPYA